MGVIRVYIYVESTVWYAYAQDACISQRAELASPSTRACAPGECVTRLHVIHQTDLTRGRHQQTCGLDLALHTH